MKPYNIELKVDPEAVDLKLGAMAAEPQGEAGTPAIEAVKDGHTMTITPSVTNKGGRIKGGTIKGEPVTLSAGDFVEGTATIKANGEYDVSSFASALVDVPAGATNVVFGEFTVTEQTTQEVEIPYNGNGYPIVVAIYPKGGLYTNTIIYSPENTESNTAICYFAVKANMGEKPDHTSSAFDKSEQNTMNTVLFRRTTKIHSFTSEARVDNYYFFKDDPTYGNIYNLLKMPTDTKLRFNVHDVGTTVTGFFAGGTYSYCIVYSE